MKKIIFLLLLSLQSFCFASESKKPQIIPSVFNGYLTELTEAYHVPGMAFVITDSEKVLFSNTYGQCKNLNQNFFIGSMSKSYTALAIMQLAEKGYINIDDDISTYLPEYKFQNSVTVRSLLNHTSGFDTHMKFHNVKITGSYGKYEYANINYDLLGKIIESVSGLSYEEYIFKNIFSPLGMTDSCANAEKMKNNRNLLEGNRNYFGLFIQGTADYPDSRSWFHEAAGFLSVTPSDYAKYLRMYLNSGITEKGEKIITSESIDSMWYDNVPLNEKAEVFYGKGWNYLEKDGMKIIFHGGQVENYISYMFILPDKELAVCFMINGNDEFGMNTLMDNAFWSTLSLLNGEEPLKVNHRSYILIHVFLDLIYLLIISLSVFILIKSMKNSALEHRSVYQPVQIQDKANSSVIERNKEKKGYIKIKNIIFMTFGYVIWPILLICGTKIFFATPLWVVKSYVPDLYMIIITAFFINLAAAIIQSIQLKKFTFCK